MAEETPTSPYRRLGALAVERGLLSQAALDELLKRQKEMSSRHYMPLGKLLLESGHVTANDLEELLAQQDAEWENKRRIGRYLLIKKIGQGGMGAVWKAVREELGGHVAIKLLPQNVANNQMLVERFHREARMMAAINHTNLVQAFDAGEDDGQPYFAMPYLEGASVGDILRKCARLGVRTTLSIALQTVRGLGHAHRAGLVHRDLKPDNLFITNDGTVKILDLGLTKLMQPETKGIEPVTLAGLIVGTPHYMAPEQVLGDQNIDGRADLYALGVTLYQMLCGRTPFEGLEIQKLLKIKLEQAAPDPQDIRPGLSPGVRNLLIRLLSRRKADRPADCKVIEAEVEALLEGMPVTGSNLSPANIVLGVSERDTRTFNVIAEPMLASGKPTELSGATRKLPSKREGDPNSTTLMPRPSGLTRPSGMEPADGEGGPLDDKPSNRRTTRKNPLPPGASSMQLGVPSAEAGETLEQIETASTAEVLPPRPTPEFVPPKPSPAEILLDPQHRRVSVGWLGQIVAAIILVIVTVFITLAIVKSQGGGGHPAPQQPDK